MIETWIITVIMVLALPLVLSWHKGELQIPGFIACLAIALIYNIWVGVLDSFYVVIPILLTVVLLFGIGGNRDE